MCPSRAGTRRTQRRESTRLEAWRACPITVTVAVSAVVQFRENYCYKHATHGLSLQATCDRDLVPQHRHTCGDLLLWQIEIKRRVCTPRITNDER